MDGWDKKSNRTAAGNKSVNDRMMVGANKCGWQMMQKQQTTQQLTIIGSVKSGQRLATRVAADN